MNNKNIDFLVNNFLRKARQAIENETTFEFRQGFLRNIVNRPVNFTTGNPYRDSNATILWLHFGPNAKVATFKQIQEAGGRVKTGAKSVKLHNTHYVDVVEHDDDTNTDVVVGTRPVTNYFNVFSINDVEGIEIPTDDNVVTLSTESNDFINKLFDHLGARMTTLTTGLPDVDVDNRVVRLPDDGRWLSEKDKFYTTIETLSNLKLNMTGTRLGPDYQKVVNSLVAASLTNYFGYEDEENSLGFLTSFMRKVESNSTFLPAVLNSTFRIVDDFLLVIQ